MGDHGARAIIPLNIFLMVGCVLLSLVCLPWWMTLIVVAVMLAIRNVARDQYGGMQLCVLLLPGAFMAIAATGKLLRDAEQRNVSLELGKVAIQAIVPIVGFAVSFVLLMVVVVAGVIAWEWLTGKVKIWRSNRQ